MGAKLMWWLTIELRQEPVVSVGLPAIAYQSTTSLDHVTLQLVKNSSFALVLMFVYYPPQTWLFVILWLLALTKATQSPKM